MAQERIKWTLSETGSLSIGFGNEIMDVYDLVKIYPEFVGMNEVQQMVVVYGIKQNLSDKIAAMKDYTLKEKVKVMGERFQSLKDGVWKTPVKEKVTLKKKAAEERAKGVTPEEEAMLKRLGL